MSSPNEHDDDLESEVIEGAEIETERYEEAEENQTTLPGGDVTNSFERRQESELHADLDEEPEGQARDTI
jgi:hypothetical protein